MKRILAAALLLSVASSAIAQDDEGQDYNLFCRATHEVSCRGGECQSTPGDSIYVGVSMRFESGVGNICTYTYCRDFALTPAPGETVADAVARGTGFTLSQSSGSTEEYIGRPAIDYQLSISEDRTRFFLGGAGNGGFGGWAGTCQPAPQN